MRDGIRNVPPVGRVVWEAIPQGPGERPEWPVVGWGQPDHLVSEPRHLVEGAVKGRHRSDRVRDLFENTPIPEAEPLVGDLRRALDHSAGWGIPAHVTILYPFVPPDDATSSEVRSKATRKVCLKHNMPTRGESAGGETAEWPCASKEAPIHNSAPSCKRDCATMRLGGVSDDDLGFAAFYEASRDSCLRAVLASVGDQRLAEDLVAEAFARAWRSWRTVRNHPVPKAWVLRTALNLRVTWWRRGRHEIPLSGHDSVSDPTFSGGIEPRLLDALKRLPGRQREVIVLRALLDLDTETTARVLGIAPGTVTTHLFRATAALQRELLKTTAMEANS
jgi:RNA polymerase sigma factor (sigma-70 family)